MAERDTFMNYVSGNWVTASTGKVSQSSNPADLDDVIGEFQSSNSADVESAVCAQQMRREVFGVRCQHWRVAGICWLRLNT